MSKIIKAADLKILIPNDSQTVIPAPRGEGDPKETAGGTILRGTNLIQDARRKAEEILAKAKQEAAAAAEQGEAELEALRLRAKKEGYEAGFREGLEAGTSEALDQASALINVLEDTVAEAAEARVRALGALEDDFLKLSLLLADKIVKKTVKDDISWLGKIIKDALFALGSVQQVTIRLNPVDYALVQEREDDLGLKARVNLQFESDFSVSQGGCLIESENGLIDARLEKRLGKIGRRLLEVLYDE